MSHDPMDDPLDDLPGFLAMTARAGVLSLAECHQLWMHRQMQMAGADLPLPPQLNDAMNRLGLWLMTVDAPVQ